MRKKLLHLILLFFLFGYQFLQAQLVFTSNPAEGVYVNCPSTTTCDGNSYDGGIVQMRLKEIDQNNNFFKFEIRKCDLNTFSGSGTFFLYRYAICNTLLEQVTVSQGDSTAVIDYPIPSDFISGTRGFYGYFHSDASGQDFNAGYITITAVTPPPFLEFNTCISAPSNIGMYDELNATYTVENGGLDYWSGNIKTILFDPNDLNVAQELSSFSRLILAGQTSSINTGNDVITLPPGNYRIISTYNNSPSGGYDVVEAASCTPIMTANTGTTTHYYPVTINAPCSDNGNISITNPTSGELFTGGLLGINWNSPNQGSNCKVKVYYTVGGGSPISIDDEHNDSGTKIWSLNTVTINSSLVKVYVEYLKPNSSGNPVVGESDYFSIFTDLIAPTQTAPADQFVFPNGTNSINLRWNKNNQPGVATYQVRVRDLIPDTLIWDYFDVGDVDEIDLNYSFQVGNDYRWVVRAHNSGGTAEQGERTFSIGDYQLDMDDPISFGVASLYEGQTYNFTAGIKNHGTTDWTGNIYLKVNNVSPAESLGSHTVAANGSEITLNYAFTPNASHVGAQVPVELFYDTGGAGTGVKVPSLIHDNPKLYDILATNMSITAPNGGESFAAGSSMGAITWNTNGPVGNVNLELTDASGQNPELIVADIQNNGFYSGYVIPINQSPGQYKIKIYEHGTNNYVDLSDGSFDITNPYSYSLELNSGIQISPPSPVSGSNATFTASVINTGNAQWTGTLKMVLLDDMGNVESTLDVDSNLILNYNDTHTLFHESIPITSAPGQYKIVIKYIEQGTTSEINVLSGTYLNPLNFTILSSSGTCTITNPNSAQQESYAAAQYLCSNGVIDQGNGDINPTGQIIKQDLAKVVFSCLYNFDPNASTPADDFPVPFGDMQDQTNQAYARYGKVLSYLEYGDGHSPFYRKFFNYHPAGTVTRGQVAKVFIEAYNFPKDVYFVPFQDVPSGHPEFLHIAKLTDLGIANSSLTNFRPDDPATREEVFIMLHRLMTQCTSCNIPQPGPTDFFTPGNYTPGNLLKHPSLSDANFDNYSKTSFHIPGRNLPLNFTHFYNSYLTELPEELFSVKNVNTGSLESFRPLGHGWGHTYHAYIKKIPGWTNPASGQQVDVLVVYWPNGGMHVYEDNGANPVAITVGLYDDITYDVVTDIYTIKKKNQIEYKFEQVNSSNADWPYMLTSVKDRNNNEILLNYEAYTGGNIRLKDVTGTASRKLNFSYYPNSGRIYKVKDPINREVIFTYSSSSNNYDLLTYRDAENYETVYNYGTQAQDRHLLKIITLPNGNFIDNQYENRKLKSTKTNQSGSGTVSQQDITWGLNSGPTSGTSSSVTIDDGTHSYTSTYTKNTLGKVTQITTPSNDLDNAQYNDTNNPTLPTNITIDGITTSYEYDSNGNITKVTQPLGIIHEFEYTALNDISKYTNPRNFSTNFGYTNGILTSISAPIGTSNITYNSFGQVKTSTNAEGIAVEYFYDNHGNVEKVVAPLGILSEATYDQVGRVKTTTNPNGQITTFDYFDRDIIDRITDPLNYITDYEYDGNGNLTDVTNALGKTTQITYDNFDWLKSISFEGDMQQFEYDDEGKLSKIIKPDDTQLQYTYFASGNLADNGYANFTYDSKNRLKTVTKDGKSLSFNYDDLHRLGSTTYDGKTVSYSYDSNGNLEKLTYPGNKDVDYTYDTNDRLKTVTDWNNNTTSYFYLLDGRLDKVDFPNGVSTNYFYDVVGRMDSTVTKNGANIICSYSFSLDPMGSHLIENKFEPLGDTSFLASNTTYTYNADNTLSMAGDDTFSFDRNGNLTTESERNYVWDNHDMLQSISGNLNASFEYDGLGHRRISTISGSTKKFVLDILGMSKVLIETDNSGNPINYYVYGLGLISRIKPNNSTRFYHGDFRGSTIAMTDESSNITHSYSYNEFGIVQKYIEDDNNLFQFIGLSGVIADDSLLYFMRARYYDPIIGRFISEDPIWNSNLYSYAGNNPIVNSDPNGEFLITLVAAIGYGMSAYAAGSAAIDFYEVANYSISAYESSLEGDYESTKLYQEAAEKTGIYAAFWNAAGLVLGDILKKTPNFSLKNIFGSGTPYDFLKVPFKLSTKQGRLFTDLVNKATKDLASTLIIKSGQLIHGPPEIVSNNQMVKTANRQSGLAKRNPKREIINQCFEQ